MEVINNNDPTYSCNPKVTIDGLSTTVNSLTVSYDSSMTTALNSISPRFGNVKGGNTITFTGTNFDADHTKYTILIDNVACVPTSASTTFVKCTAGKRPGIYEKPTLSLSISDKGMIATKDLVYRYMNLWSDDDTWGGEFAPVEGESVYVPKGLHLLVDVDATPILNAVIVEGSLVFPPNDADANHLRTFDAHYVFVNGGYLEVGTEEFPYTSKLVITMYGNKQSPEIPIYGNKCIAIRNGVLDMHGAPRNPTWT